MKNLRELIDKLMSYIARNPKVLLVAAGLLLLLDVVFVLRFQIAQMSKLFKESARLRTDIRASYSDKTSATSYEEKFKKIMDDLQRMEQKVVLERNFAVVLESISKQADACGVRILKVKPEDVKAAAKAKPARAPKTKTPAAPAPTGELFVRRKVTVSAVGNFHQLSRYMTLLENSDPFFEVKKLEIVTDDVDYIKQDLTIVLESVLRKS